MADRAHTPASPARDANQADASIGSKSIFGFWVYLMTDCVLFASLFATFVVLRKSTFGGPGGEDLFSLPFVLIETLILLTSSFSCGLAIVAARRGHTSQVMQWFGVTFLLGLAFLALELGEFSHLVVDGNSWRASAFLSAFFILVGTHGFHITVGLIWMGCMMVAVWRRGLEGVNLRRLICLSLFWHFLDIIWIFIFTIVYLYGLIL